MTAHGSVPDYFLRSYSTLTQHKIPTELPDVFT